MEEEEAEAMVNSIEPHLSRQTKRSCALSAREQTLVALRYLATGGQFRLVGDAHGVSPATVSRCVHRVVAVINDVFFNDVVKFPDRGECFDIPARFREVTKSGMPCVIGLVDGTHVKIIGPSENEEQFVNLHDDHSINCMLVCGPNLKVSCQLLPITEDQCSASIYYSCFCTDQTVEMNTQVGRGVSTPNSALIFSTSVTKVSLKVK